VSPGAHAEDRAVTLVHRAERGRHAGGRLEEPTATHALMLRQTRAQLLDARLDLFLPLGLGRRGELVAGDELRRGRRGERRGFGRQELHVVTSSAKRRWGAASCWPPAARWGRSSRSRRTRGRAPGPW